MASPPAFQVSISDNQDAWAIDELLLKRVTEDLLRDEGAASAEISIALVDDPTIHDINRRFLHHDYPTDVISFLLSDAPSELEALEPRHIDGEVVISTETAKRTAAELGCPPDQELALYLIHGLLHLCGYDDQTVADRRQMRLREQSHLQKSGPLPNYEY